MNPDIEFKIANVRNRRIMSLRYMTAGFFFANVYYSLHFLMQKSWMILVPVIQMVLFITCMVEQYASVKSGNDQIVKNKICYEISIGISSVVFILTIFNRQLTMPFILNLGFGLTVLGLIIAGKAMMLVKIDRVIKRQDKQYKPMRDLERLYKKGAKHV